MKKDLDKGEMREIKNLTDYTRLYSTRIRMLASITSRSRLPESCQTLLRRIASIYQQQVTRHEGGII